MAVQSLSVDDRFKNIDSSVGLAWCYKNGKAVCSVYDPQIKDSEKKLKSAVAAFPMQFKAPSGKVVYNSLIPELVLVNADDMLSDDSKMTIHDFAVQIGKDQLCVLKLSSPFEQLVLADNTKGYKTDQFVKATLCLNIEKMDEIDGAKCLTNFDEEVQKAEITETLFQRFKRLF